MCAGVEWNACLVLCYYVSHGQNIQRPTWPDHWPYHDCAIAKWICVFFICVCCNEILRYYVESQWFPLPLSRNFSPFECVYKQKHVDRWLSFGLSNWKSRATNRRVSVQESFHESWIVWASGGFWSRPSAFGWNLSCCFHRINVLLELHHDVVASHSW